MVAVSVVIPVYNVEDYLEECLDSIINQTFEDMEIICINDGSTDNSLKILEKYAASDDRIKIFTQENQGLSASRNHGKDYSEGEYVYYMDSDDILELNAIEELYNFSKSNDLDIVIFKLINFDDDTLEKYTMPYYEMSFLQPFDQKVFTYRDVGDNVLRIAVSAPGKFFKRELISPLHFPEGLIFEDNLFFAEAMIKAKRVSFLDRHYYNRRIRNNSITTSKTIKFADSLIIANKIMELFKRENIYEDYKKVLMEAKIRTANNRFSQVDLEYKEEFFQRIRSDFSNYIEEFEGDDVFKHEVDEFLRYRFRAVFFSEDYKDYELKCTSYQNKIKIKNLQDKHIELKEKQKYFNEKNNEILSSKSWKITKPLRIITGGSKNG